MIRFEYKVLPAPARGQRGKGVKGADGKFANALEQLMNQMGRDGWEYQRAETLPSEERAGIASKTTVFRNVLVFRRPIETDVDAFEPKLLDAPTAEDQPQEDRSPATNEPILTASEDDIELDEEPDVIDPLRMRANQLSQSD